MNSIFLMENPFNIRNEIHLGDQNKNSIIHIYISKLQGNMNCCASKIYCKVLDKLGEFFAKKF